jgi:hypothetical protein
VFRGVLGGSQDRVAVGGVGVDDGHGEGLRRVLGMLMIGPLDDRRYERLARAQDDERFGVVLEAGIFEDYDPAQRTSAEAAIRAARESAVRGVCALFDEVAER